MMLLQLILIIGPGVLAARIYETKKQGTVNSDLFHNIYDVSKFTLLIFWVVNILQYLRGWGEFDWSRFSVQFLIKYIPLAVVLAIGAAVLQLLWDGKKQKK